MPNADAFFLAIVILDILRAAVGQKIRPTAAENVLKFSWKHQLNVCRFSNKSNLPIVIWVKFHDPFNTIFISKHSGICTPGTVTNRPFHTATC